MNATQTIWLKNTWMNILTTVTLMLTALTQRDPSTARASMGILVMELPVWVRLYGICMK